MSYIMVKENYTQKDGQRLFEEDKICALADPEFRAIYGAESSKKELWLQSVKEHQWNPSTSTITKLLRRLT